MPQWLRPLVVLPGDLVQIPAPTWQLTAISNSSSKGFSALFWPPQTHGMHTVHSTQIYM